MTSRALLPEQLPGENRTADTRGFSVHVSRDGNVIKGVAATRAVNSFAYYSLNVTCVLVQPSASTRNAHAILLQ